MIDYSSHQNGLYTILIRLLIITISLSLLDGLWLGVIATKMYINGFGNIMRISNGSIQPNWPAAIVVYIALIIGIMCFVLPQSTSPLSALLWGGLFGLVSYAIYDFTNMAVLANWPLKVSILDTLWGMVLCGLTSFVTVLLTQNTPS